MRIKTFAAAVTGAMALLVVGVPGALAQGPINLRQGLELTEAGAPVAPGATVFNEDLVVGQCFVESTGKLLNNGDPIDEIVVGSPTHYYCEGGASASGGIRSVTLADNDTALLYSTMTVTTAEHCAYQFALMQGIFYGDVYVTGSATGFEVRSQSVPGCASTLTTEFGVAELRSVTDGALEVELVPGPKF